jgi:hypothetical protein
VKQQKFLILLLEKQVTRRNNGLYKSGAFYRMVMYLKKNNLIQSRRQDNNQNIYMLTLKGNMMGKILAGLSDVPAETRDKFGLN